MPTEIEVDATAALAGPMRDRVSRASRYLAARLAMVRQSIQDGQIAPIKIPGVGHTADGFTKPIVRVAFRTFAAANLGLEVDDLVAPGRVQAAPGASHNGGYGGDFASRSGDTCGGGRGAGAASGDSAPDDSGSAAAPPPGTGDPGRGTGDTTAETGQGGGAAAAGDNRGGDRG